MATGLGNIAAFSLVTPLSDLHKWNKGIANTARGFDRLNSSALNFKAIIGGGLLIGAAKNVLTLSDNYQVLSRRIAGASSSAEDFRGNMDSLVSVAMSTGTALNTNVKLFQDLERAGLGSSTEIRSVSKAVAEMGVLSGATTEDMKYGIRQLSQGLSAGVFRAEEFNSVQENTPEIMKQIRIGLGKTQGQLRQMVLEGKLLSKDVFRVLVERADEVAAAFAKIPPDMNRGIEATKTGLTVFFGKIDKSLGITRALAKKAFDFGNFLASDAALQKALKAIATFEVYFKHYIMNPAQAAFRFLKDQWDSFVTFFQAGISRMTGGLGIVDGIKQVFINAYNGIRAAWSATLNFLLTSPAVFATVATAAIILAGVLSYQVATAAMSAATSFAAMSASAYRAIPATISLAKSMIGLSINTTIAAARAIPALVASLGMLVRMQAIATIGMLRLNLAMMANPAGIIIAGLLSIVTALGYFAGKSADTGNTFLNTWIGIQAIFKTIGDRFMRVFGGVIEFFVEIGKVLGQIVSGLGKAIAQGFDAIANYLSSWVNMVSEWIAGFVNIEAIKQGITDAANFIGGGMAGISNVVLGYVDNIKNGWQGLWIMMKKAFTFGDTSELDAELAAVTEKMRIAGNVAGQFQDGVNNFDIGDAINNIKALGTEVTDVISNLRFDPSVLGLDHFWDEVLENVAKITKARGADAGKDWTLSFGQGLKDYFGKDLSSDIEARLKELNAKVNELPMKIDTEKAIDGNFEEAGEVKASEFMQGFTDAFEAFGKSTSQMMTDALFGDSSVSFKEIARKLVKDLLTNTIHFLLISPLVKSMQALLGSMFKLPDGTNPFDQLSNAANGVEATKKTPGQAAGGIGAIFGGIGNVLKMFGGGSPAASAAGSLTSSFLQPSTAGLLQSGFSDSGSMGAPSQSFNNYFNIAANEPATFMEARGRIGNQITRTQRNS